ncbi:uncharacterized protein LOC106160764 [Lingula anatina]|uniref:Uncharacterized protein LOC106160764 n=1 Tax=Lingula anatina TaxID=7574 RepID=A0A1S3I502_LINAN|nr:uncharacterized protein LOC106160764 [Lingula anatina]|eukprot:XP_013392911.1 uncharacterized protein LOC106160764 [Lingula anatina]
MEQIEVDVQLALLIESELRNIFEETPIEGAGRNDFQPDIIMQHDNRPGNDINNNDVNNNYLPAVHAHPPPAVVSPEEMSDVFMTEPQETETQEDVIMHQTPELDEDVLMMTVAAVRNRLLYEQLPDAVLCCEDFSLDAQLSNLRLS